MPGGGAATDRAKEEVSFLTSSHSMMLTLLVNRVSKKYSDLFIHLKKQLIRSKNSPFR
jgi:hypothetical protein